MNFKYYISLFTFCGSLFFQINYVHGMQGQQDLYADLFRAVKSADDVAVEKIINQAEENDSPLCLDRSDAAGTPLQWACSYTMNDGVSREKNYIKIVKLLLQAGANPNAESWFIPAPLICAARHCHLEMMQELFKTSYKETILADEWNNVLPEAAQSSCPIELCKEISDFIQPVDPNVTETLKQDRHCKNKPLSPLAYAMIANWHHKYQPSTENSKHHYYETFKKQAIELLIDAGAEINITIDLDDSHDYYHCLPYKLQDDKWVPLNPSTPLLLAVGYGEKEIVKLLLDHGANPYATSNGKTALDIANTNAIVDNPAIHEPAREIATLLVDAQKR